MSDLERLKELTARLKHMPGKHDQSQHGRGGKRGGGGKRSGGAASATASNSDKPAKPAGMSEATWLAIQANNAMLAGDDRQMSGLLTQSQRRADEDAAAKNNARETKLRQNGIKQATSSQDAYDTATAAKRVIEAEVRNFPYQRGVRADVITTGADKNGQQRMYAFLGGTNAGGDSGLNRRIMQRIQTRLRVNGINAVHINDGVIDGYVVSKL